MVSSYAYKWRMSIGVKFKFERYSPRPFLSEGKHSIVLWHVLRFHGRDRVLNFSVSSSIRDTKALKVGPPHGFASFCKQIFTRHMRPDCAWNHTCTNPHVWGPFSIIAIREIRYLWDLSSKKKDICSET